MRTAGVGVVRGARTLLALLAVLGVSAAAHELGGGHVPGALALVVLGVVLAPATWLALARPRGPLALLTLLAGAQVVVHVGLASMAPGVGARAPMPGHDHLPAGLSPGSAAVMPEMGHAGPSMLLLHVVATLALALLLSRVEDVLWRVVCALLPRVAAVVHRPALVRLAVAATAPRPAGRAPRPVGGRAPPVALARA
ncbi:hypothetical protein [Phycicoccus sonneratiae]|uniref:MFS transporter n=1 Tax=Phycicoccus sonneratiae TaxID=2807628 RepID=A0ABS2CKQ2_9MICO|nr:hypothetical protein [Phycicoccus sonneraticus]MBM6400360.1 hypothetical protein [Phycicoccus sonneraticus]